MPSRRWRKSRGTPRAQNAKRRVSKLSPNAEAARDEGPRLIPLPDVDSPLPLRPGELGGLPTNRYVALADIALRLWNAKPETQANNSKKTEPPMPRRPKR